MSHNTEMIHNNMDPSITCYCPDTLYRSSNNPCKVTNITAHKCREINLNDIL